MQMSPVKDAILARRLGMPADFGPVGVLPFGALDEVTEGLALTEGALLADIACGRGGYGIEVARRADARLAGVDFSAVALGQARRTAARRLGREVTAADLGRPARTGLPGPRANGDSPSAAQDAPHGTPANTGWPGSPYLDTDRAQFWLGTLTGTGLSTESVDALLCTDSIQLAGPPAAALAEFRRVLRRGGRLVLTTWLATDPGDARVPERIRRLDLRRDLTDAGFEDVVVEERPEWAAAERGLYEEAVTTPNDGNDLALASLQDEGRAALEDFDKLRRVVAFATRP
ncbi:hypothetical protein Kisp02_40500 [Kineosporia sp. NBRC 101731]|nr:hypothetical protein Kisp02_40500 [Kineosporia sp. NBRC 101731]